MSRTSTFFSYRSCPKGQVEEYVNVEACDVVDSGKYLGVTINKDLTWTKHINQTIGKASKTLGFLRRNLGRCTTKTKATAYTTLVRPVLEYASPVWDPHQITTTRDIEQVQRRAARFAYNCYQDNSPGCEHVSRLMQSENGISIYIYISRLMQSENGILLLFYIFLSHGNKNKK